MTRTSNKGRDETLTMTNHHDHYQNRSNEAELLVCECCALVINNGDESSCRDFHGHTHPRCDSAIAHLTNDRFTVGYFSTNCNGCGRIQLDGAHMYGAIRTIN